MKNILVTGGAGFIGSNLVEALLKDDRVGRVRVLDNLSNGFLHNVEEFMNNPNFEFVEGDITDYAICVEACKGIHLVSHQAALGSVPRSIKDPIARQKADQLVVATNCYVPQTIDERIQKVNEVLLWLKR